MREFVFMPGGNKEKSIYNNPSTFNNSIYNNPCSLFLGPPTTHSIGVTPASTHNPTEPHTLLKRKPKASSLARQTQHPPTSTMFGICLRVFALVASSLSLSFAAAPTPTSEFLAAHRTTMAGCPAQGIDHYAIVTIDSEVNSTWTFFESLGFTKADRPFNELDQGEKGTVDGGDFGFCDV